LGSLEVWFGAKSQDIDAIRLALALLFTLDQADPFQLRMQLSGDGTAVPEVLSNLRNHVIHICPACPVPPAVPRTGSRDQAAEQTAAFPRATADDTSAP
jgi:hypothetical protein